MAEIDNSRQWWGWETGTKPKAQAPSERGLRVKSENFWLADWGCLAPCRRWMRGETKKEGSVHGLDQGSKIEEPRRHAGEWWGRPPPCPQNVRTGPPWLRTSFMDGPSWKAYSIFTLLDHYDQINCFVHIIKML